MLACRALNSCAFEDVKVVIVGQDPYHNDGQVSSLQQQAQLCGAWFSGRRRLCAGLLLQGVACWPAGRPQDASH